VIAHETAHMWFGDLVTMRWFDDVWLKEVFANLWPIKSRKAHFPMLTMTCNFWSITSAGLRR
jgi:aminopeptidase N